MVERTEAGSLSATGLTAHELELIRQVAAQHSEITGLILFGSRAMGTAEPSSDIDIAIEGVDDPLRAETIAGDLDELPLPYRFDVHALAAIQSEALRDHIARVGLRIYG